MKTIPAGPYASEDILDHFEGVKPDGRNHWMALCPAHADQNPSLSINLADDGTWVLHCFAGCTFAGIVEAAEIDQSRLFADAGRPRDNGHERVFEYRDEEGALLYKVHRLGTGKGKKIWQSRGDGKMGGLGDIQRVPYRLPELLRSTEQGEPVFIVEGEAKVEALRAWGLAATCNSGGAGKWLPEFSKHLDGATVIILPDNDAPGREHAQKVAESLQGVASSVKVVELPGLGPKGDIVDWIAAGHTQQELLAAIFKSPEWDPESEWEASSGFTTLSKLLAEPKEDRSYVVDGLLPTAGTSLLIGKPKDGKSWTARQLEMCVANGIPFLGRRVLRGRVAVFALEEKRGELAAHYRAMGADGNEDVLIRVGAAPQDALGLLSEVVKRYRPTLVVIDTLFRFARVTDAADYSEVTAALEPINTIARQSGAHILCVHHSNKGGAKDIDSILGSTAIGGAVDSMLFILRDGKTRYLKSVQRYGDSIDDPITLELNPRNRTLSVGLAKEAGELEVVERDILDYLGTIEGPVTEPEINASVEGKTTVKRKALRELVKSKKVERYGKGQKNAPFTYQMLVLPMSSDMGTSIL